MRLTVSLAAALAGAALTLGCAGSGTNEAQLYTPQQGTIKLTAATTDTTIQKVNYTLDGGTVLGSSTDAANGFAYNFDTTQVKPGIHTVRGTTDAGVILVDNTIFINNPPGQAAPGGSGTPNTAPTNPPAGGGGTASPAPNPSAS